jgi:hypothetical protein
MRLDYNSKYNYNMWDKNTIITYEIRL